MRDFTVTVPGFTIACKAWGDQSSAPMLALHGWLDNANSFSLLAPMLEKKFHLIAVDLPGHGLSSHLDDGAHYHFIDAIFTVINIIKALGFDKVHLLGHSMGACLASLIAGVIPERILSMALIEALGPFSSPEESCRSQLASYVQACHSERAKKAKPYETMELAAQARAKSGHLSIEFARLLCQRGVKEYEGRFYWRHDRRLIQPTPLQMTHLQIVSCLKAITASSCLILAKDGFAFDESEMQKRINAVQHLLVHRISGGHHLHMEKPVITAHHLLAFYDTLELT